MTTKQVTERKLSIREALWEAVMEEIPKNEKICIWGEGVTSKIAFDYPDLLKNFPTHIQNMPISEACMVSAGLGASLVGLKPIVDLSFDDLLPRALDEILNQATKARYVTSGVSKPSMIIKMDLPPVRCAQTGQRLESMLMHAPGIAIAVPSTPSDAMGLMKSSLRTEDVVVVVEDRWIAMRESVSPDEIDFGKAIIRRKGNDLTLVTYGYMVYQALEAAEKLAPRGIDLEVLDLRTLVPMDTGAILESVRKTRRLATLEGGYRVCGIGAEVCSLVCEKMMDQLDLPPVRLASDMIPIPVSPALRMKVFPSTDDISKSIEKMIVSAA